MKKCNYLLFCLVIFLFFSCEKQAKGDVYVETSESRCAIRENNNSIFRITENRAFEYANIVFNRNKIRSISEITVDYVVEQSNARSLSADTLAYIFNRGDNEGFVIISSDNRVNPLLAFSDSGHFDNDENPVVHQEFISKLGDYIDANSENDTVSFSADFFDGCYAMQSSISGSWDQGDPWNSVVDIYYPDCLVGCVAVATAIIMTHSKESLFYHGKNFPLARIGAGIDQNTNNARVVGGSGSSSNSVVPLPYDSAVSYAAELLYYIGMDVHMDYGQSVSLAKKDSGLILLRDYSFPLRHNQLMTYNLIDIIDYIRAGDIIYMRGSDINGRGGHAWIADAAMYCVDYETDETTDGYLYCHWGWGGYCDGFYNGNVFPTANYSFGNMQYFAVDRYFY